MSILNSGMVSVIIPFEEAEFLAKNCEESMKQGTALLMPLGDIELSPPQREDIRRMLRHFEIIKAAAERAIR